MKKSVAVLLALLLTFSLCACKNSSPTAEIGPYNDAVKAFNSAEGVKMTVASKLSVSAGGNSSVTENNSVIYEKRVDAYEASAEIDSLINTTSAVYGFYISDNVLYASMMGISLKTEQGDAAQLAKMRSVISSFSTDMIMGADNKPFTATDLKTEEGDAGTSYSFSVTPSSLDNSTVILLKALLDIDEKITPEFKSISVNYTVDTDGFLTHVGLNASATASAGTSELSADIDIEKFSGDIACPASIDKDGSQLYDLNEIVEVANMM